ncbi:MAG: DUF3793 family protein [Clostridiales bacterium]|mgnify:FL=1|jgi:hypothetical protein|uniref:DUF3793 family protein n=1 Tax=Bovifimicola ammoniilytica TaxID=2981720 RepID=UPI000336C8B3|nr:DUF3793 family protein [Bovifimicola ammoniilytica]MBD8942525.1 DUF3793 family protein [Clostridiales bacterium]MCU6752645.1 DUF3793 family protein [Bovifimicola ammoniilytica]CCZ04004.1 putative uncharacterized protein [Eubacterium sp. CAG:603]SCJ31892.1 Protein of uncharacterised function (DUF3793) [uncultured Eubacterium sp.]
MSQEIYEIVKGMDLENIETQLALQCAPLITGLKVSNLLIISKGNEEVVKRILNRTGISYYRLIQTRTKTTFLLFRRNELEEFLSDENVRNVLMKAGYKSLQIDKILRTFSLRYEAYIQGDKSFPHEMGLLLGYPVEDVVGFVENNGKNFLYSGYWKVYENQKAKVKLFDKFKVAEETLIHLLSNGLSMSDIIDIYAT